MKVQRTDVPITITPEQARKDTVGSIRKLNEALQREYRRRIEIEARLDRLDRVVYGPTNEQPPQSSL